MVDILKADRQKVRQVLSERAGVLFFVMALFWAFSFNFAVWATPGISPVQALAVFAMIAVAAGGSLMASFKLSRELIPWTIIRTVIVGASLLLGSAIYTVNKGIDPANGPYYDGPTPMGAVGIAGMGVLAAAVFGVGGFLALYIIHGPSGRGSIEDDILDDE